MSSTAQSAETPAAEAPTWTPRTVRLGDLMPWKRNPRKMSQQQAARLVESFAEFGQVEVLALGPGLELYNGHQRLKALAEVYGADYLVEARVCSRELTEKEREKLTIYLHKGAAGEFDLEVLLREFNPIELDAWGMPDLNIPDVAENEWVGMPDFDGRPRMFSEVIVRFDAEADMQAFAALVGREITKDTTAIWFPDRPQRDLSTEQWVASDEP